MTLRPVQVNIKARDEAALGRFWADALDWATSSEAPGVINLEPRGFDWPDPAALTVDLVRIPDTARVRYRTHVDLATTSVEHEAELVARLRGLGATPLDVGQGKVPWVVMADPEGNAFCVLGAR
ncbi:VOC family protein [Isoptericola sp. AK164]|uniref:VOC family protein n=1 Tax=Isoptericola sp. AK164 TaxID=3024246 RepID=UPI0024182DF1|nr:VOC family protein [Isoptericola sp. AK164]